MRESIQHRKTHKDLSVRQKAMVVVVEIYEATNCILSSEAYKVQ